MSLKEKAECPHLNQPMEGGGLDQQMDRFSGFERKLPHRDRRDQHAHRDRGRDASIARNSVGCVLRGCEFSVRDTDVGDLRSILGVGIGEPVRCWGCPRHLSLARRGCRD